MKDGFSFPLGIAPEAVSRFVCEVCYGTGYLVIGKETAGVYDLVSEQPPWLFFMSEIECPFGCKGDDR